MEAGRLIEWKAKIGDRVKRGQVVAIVDTDKAAIEVEIWKTGVLREILIHEREKVPVGTVLARFEVSEESELPKEPMIPEVVLSPLQKVIARAMETSKREIPHYYLSRRVGIDAVLRWVEAQNQTRAVEDRILLIAPVLRAVIRACLDQPLLNGHYRDGKFLPSRIIHPALVISLRSGGSIAPAIPDAGAMTSAALMSSIQKTVERLRESGTVRSSEFGEGTIAVTNLMDSGVDRVFGVIHPPQVAMVGLGAPFREAMEVQGRVEFRTVIEVTLSGDHRVSDGRIGALFLKKIDEILSAGDPR